ncbi:MAG: site-2 protease family protein [Gemmataceae bacterium]
MLRSLRVGRLFGVDVFLHWTFWALPIFYIIVTKSYTPLTAAFALAIVATLAVCVVLHEFGHVLMARLFGIGTKDIIMTPLGGLARLERMSERPFEEILIALAGPAVNFVITLMLIVPAMILFPADGFEGRITTGRQFLVVVTGLNIMLVVFNMIPAFPTDGGRVFRAILALFFSRLTATRIAVYVGVVFAVLIAIAGVSNGNFLAPVVAGFLIMVGQLELYMLRKITEARRRALREVNALPLDDELEPAPLPPPEPNFSGYTWDKRLSAWVEWRGGWPVRKCRMHTW